MVHMSTKEVIQGGKLIAPVVFPWLDVEEPPHSTAWDYSASSVQRKDQGAKEPQKAQS